MGIRKISGLDTNLKSLPRWKSVKMSCTCSCHPDVDARNCAVACQRANHSTAVEHRSTNGLVEESTLCIGPLTLQRGERKQGGGARTM
jgi:hypothetical protein